MKMHADDWNPEQSARGLSSRPILLPSTTANEWHVTLLAALHAAHARQVTAMQ
jgi:hypothetical protein